MSKKINIPKEIKLLAQDTGFTITRSEFTKLKEFLSPLQGGKSRTKILYEMAKNNPDEIIRLFKIVLNKEKKEKLDLSEVALLGSREVDIDSTVSSMFDFK